MKVGGGAKQDVSLEQGMQLSIATQTAATTTKHHHTEKLSEIITNLYTHQDQQRRKEMGGKLPHKSKIKLLLKRTARPSRVSTHHLKLSENQYIK